MKFTTRFMALAAAAAFSCAVQASSNRPTSSAYLITHKAQVSASPAAVYAALGQVDKWWSARHTYSGKPENLKLDMRGGGCFCEAWDGGSAEHARVVLALRDKTLRLEGGLGLLQEKAVTAILNFALSAEGGKTTILVTYRVRAVEGGLDASNELVDKVIGEQVEGLVGYLNRK